MQLGFSLPYPADWAAPDKALLQLARKCAEKNLWLEITLLHRQYEGIAPTTEEIASIAQGLLALRAQGVTIWSVHLPFGKRYDPSSADPDATVFTFENWKRLMDAAVPSGARIAVCHPSFEPIAPKDRPGHLNRAKENLDNLGAIAQSIGMTLAVECLPRTCLCSSAAEMKQLLDGIRPMACVDVNHPHKEPPADFIRAIGDKIVTTHISDDDGLDEKHWWPGAGVIDFADVFSALDEIKYSGPFLYELNPAGGDWSAMPEQVIGNYHTIGGK